ncbi:MAG: 23S rRNA (adenine(2030)-N(6))-methyltransferase RlmJ [Methylococcaceae bacterium]|jgi:23S rRNA (adenine2030-N6)-methyltransferase
MLSYLHAYHAGNFADVLKHLVLIHSLDYLLQKDKALCYIDTHAGSGLYPLNSPEAQKNCEFEQGIAKLWLRDNLPTSVSRYLECIKLVNPSGNLSKYPGSAVLAQQILRPKDRLFLFELHTTENKHLNNLLRADKRIKIAQNDGLKEALSLLPPIQHRGFVLIDPSYEIKTDYKTVVSTLTAMHKRFSQGLFALWYPVVDRSYNNDLEKRLKDSALSNVQLFELGLENRLSTQGMAASGMIVINPPWTLKAEMETTLPWLAQTLGPQGQGFFRIEQLINE